MATPNAALPTSPNGATDISVAYNASMQIIDALLPLVVQSATITAPPVTVLGDVGKRWLVPAGATGAWAGQTGKVALCTAATVWAFITAPARTIAYNEADSRYYRFDGGTWAATPSAVPVVQSIASAATITPAFGEDLVKVTAQAAAANIANPSGTGIAGWGFAIRIKDNGTARALTYGSQYRAATGVTLPTTTVVGKTTYIFGVWNSDDSKVDVMSVAEFT